MQLWLSCFRALAQVFVPRSAEVPPLNVPCTTACSDTSFHQTLQTTTLGLAVYIPDNQQVAPCDFVLSPMVPWNIGKLIRGHDVRWFGNDRRAVLLWQHRAALTWRK